ncbi:Hypothetical protein GbCGDNIH9_8593 [Granulibacter bethesdensis]|uniref:Uncharacterized protein n=1 Tax=Granulibacter bethesdensis TaxID=364410 RepID=A0AAC9KAW9_9PROT|nr:Hypothetical protein GbCGDNIH9_8593 [Granulibacter bethesdensis]APH62470.1 Hypothetical protein GbCGDNIH8_8593 [Granulibacter bethesdensis]
MNRSSAERGNSTRQYKQRRGGRPAFPSASADRETGNEAEGECDSTMRRIKNLWG